MKLKYILLQVFALLLLQFMVATAQQKSLNVLSGKIVDNLNNPVAGMRVAIQEDSVFTVTNTEGLFTITAARGAVLVLTKPDYLTAYVTVTTNTKPVFHVSRSMNAAGEDDDVNIPFGVTKRRNINGSVSSIKASTLPQLPTSSLPNLLSGQIPGLNVYQTGTIPGREGSTILVRNQATYTGSNVPLILVDGVVRDFTDMDLGEIASITVMKDAASLAWYGIRGANGALLVTTKRGSASETKFTYDMQMGLQMPTNLMQPVDSYTYATLFNQTYQNDGNPPYYSAATLAGYQANQDPYNYPNVNFVNTFFKKNALTQRHVLSASGGNSAIRYFTLLSYYNQSGLFNYANTPLFSTNVSFQRINLRSNVDVKITPMLTAQLDLGGRVEDRNEPGGAAAAVLSAIFGTPSNSYPITNIDGSYGGTATHTTNPLAQLQNTGYTDETTRVLLGTLNVTHKLDFLTQGLSANIYYTFDLAGTYTTGRTQAFETYQFVPGSTTSATKFGAATPLNYYSAAYNNNIRTNELWFGGDYKRSFGKNDISASLRYQQAYTFYAAKFEDKRDGISARVSDAYNNRYYVDLVASYTGSDSFMPGKQFGWFPAIGLGWVATEEKFLKGQNLMSYLKLRGSYGLAGNSATNETNKFPYASLYNSTGGIYAFGTTFNNQVTTSERALPNPNITWEKALKTDVGFDAKFFNNSVYLSGTYFNEDRKDILTNPTYPSILGLASFRINDGESRVRGVEGEINFTKSLGKLTLNLGGDYTYAPNKVIHINETGGLAPYQTQTGYNIGNVVGFGKLMYVSDGLFKSQADINSSPAQTFGRVFPGDIKYKDINGDGKIDSYDRVMTNYNDIPDTYYGFHLGVNYRGVDLNVQMQGVAHRTVQIRSLILTGSINNGFITQFSPQAWTPANPNAAYPRLTETDRVNDSQDSDFWLRSGDYLRVKSVELGYTIPNSLDKKLRIQGLRIFVTGINLYTFSHTGLNIDPELPTSGYDSYPYLRTVAAGLNLKF